MDAPKSRLDIVMERLRKQDEEAGIKETPLTDEQRAAIAEARNLHEAKVAERRILHQSSVLKTYDPAERLKLEEEFRRDLERLEADRDSRIRRIRSGGPAAAEPPV